MGLESGEKKTLRFDVMACFLWDAGRGGGRQGFAVSLKLPTATKTRQKYEMS